ncbi:hypothetical protein QTN24_01460 [Cupriavidus sp. SZY C1]|uniref:hypothetical protein n=1 Tax=Cupriavidus sp. SZY C1 TaxID=3055037 RepID=UPI0028B51D26|nr:hypothetical protein [Cupriavidus sp. SZY C1]MDT6960152.1 hypothetical protein [Cupriavidus sp. SZY C1]
MSRIVCQFSCGAASAVATKLAIAQFDRSHDVRIINAFLREEHVDNRRFATDCETWFGRPITALRDERYGASVIQVFRRKQYMKGPMGAPCSKALKRDVLDAWKQPGDIMVFGYTVEEKDRFDDFQERNPDRPVIAPLIDAQLSKEDCKAMIHRAGIELPAMYRLGYENANCIGCVKGGEGYWRAIRVDFPEYFEATCLLQDEIGEGSWFLRHRSGPLKDQRFPLRDLRVGPVVRNERLPSCSFFCEIAEQEYSA